MAAEHDEGYDGELVQDEVTLLLTKLQGEGISNGAIVWGVFCAIQN
jgi:hypothetical protein